MQCRYLLEIEFRGRVQHRNSQMRAACAEAWNPTSAATRMGEITAVDLHLLRRYHLQPRRTRTARHHHSKTWPTERAGHGIDLDEFSTAQE